MRAPRRGGSRQLGGVIPSGPSRGFYGGCPNAPCTCDWYVSFPVSCGLRHPRAGPADRLDDRSGGVLPGVTVEARSNVLPGPRVTVTGGDGIYQLPALPPGDYTLTFTLQGMQTATKKVAVQLSETTAADASLAVGGVTEAVTVTAEASLIDKSSAALTSGITNDT